MVSTSEKPIPTGVPSGEAKRNRVSLSIVIPAFNEGARLPRTFERIRHYLNSRQAGQTASDKPVTIEILVVDDGSQDNTAEVVLSWQSALPGLRLLSNGVNRGKGYSVRHGMLEANGHIALFTDADLSAPIEEMGKLVEALASAEIAIGSRGVDRSLIETRQSNFRELAGITFNMLVRLITGIRFHDTQCGFKAFLLSNTRIVFEQQRIEGFGFDPEILFLAKHYGFRSVEIPVRWAHDPATKVHVVRDSFKMVADLLRIRWNWLTGRYSERKPLAFAVRSLLGIR
jgi:glycosyltransferase involved in cell wall biosynthesis